METPLHLHFCHDCYEVLMNEWEDLESKYGESKELDDRIIMVDETVENMEIEYGSHLELGDEDRDWEYVENEPCHCCGSGKSGYRHHFVMPYAVLR